MLKLQSSVLQGLPVTQTNTYGAAPSTLQNILGTTGGIATLTKNLTDAGLSPSTITKYLQSLATNSSPLPTYTSSSMPSGSTQNSDGTWTTPDGTVFTVTADDVPNPNDPNAWGGG